MSDADELKRAGLNSNIMDGVGEENYMMADLRELGLEG